MSEIAEASSGLDTPVALTPEALTGLLRLTAPEGPVTMKGFATDVRYWSKPGDNKVARIYGRLVMGDSSIRFELQPHADVQEGTPVVLHGALRIKPAEAYRTTHEVLLVGDAVGRWLPHTPAVQEETLAPLVRLQPRLSLEEAIDRHGLGAMAFLATGTAWGDLTTAASAVPAIARCRHVETNFMQPERFVEDMLELCRDPGIKMLVIARGGGAGLELIGDAHSVTAALLASERAFYTALGHERNTLLLDKHADQPFPTPSILGQQLAAAVKAIEDRRALAERLRTLGEQVGKLTQERDQLQARLEAKQQPDSGPREVREPGNQYGGSRTTTPAPSPSRQTALTNNRYALMGIVLLIVFLLGRCSS
ncbi:TPA: exodeoxyribonuclease VII large subunit [Pseudomonas aeruginosa]